MKLAEKVALVTGSSQGIVCAIAIKLASEGAKVAINYRSHPEGAEATLAQIEAIGGQCFTANCPKSQGYTIQGDVGAIAEIQRAIAQTIEHFGKLDILVNNAGIEKHAPREKS